ncbi:hypothetical protein IJ182_02985 [bacterium]|nr:hypothetical protein [bacterium]
MGEAVEADKKHRFIGSFANEQATGTSANEVFDLKEGDDTIYFDISGNNKIGKNTVYLTQGENLEIDLNGDTSENTIASKISGNDIITTVYKNNKSIGSITFKNAAKENAVGSLKIWGTNNNIVMTNLLTQNYTINKSKSKKGVKIKGTALNETITGSKKEDTIYTGSGNDTICTGKGKDTVIINGQGKKDIYIHKNEGNKTIKFQNVKNTDDITLYLDDTYCWDTFNPIKKGDNLYLETSYWDFNTNKDTTKTYFLLNYFNDSYTPTNLYYKDGDNSAEKISDYLNDSNKENLKVYGDKKRNVVGTDYDEYLYGSDKKDIISTGDGFDRIYAGKGNDEIRINGVGDKNIYVSDNDGNKIINISSGFSDDINLYTNSTDILSAEIADNDLILYRTFDSGKTTKTEKIEYRNLLLTDNKLDMVYINDRSFADLYSDTIFPYVKITNRKGKFDVTYNDNSKIIKASSKKDTITITKSTSPRVFAGAGNDTINITDSAAFITGGAGKDTINIDNAAVVINHKTGDGNDIINIQSDNTSAKLNLSVQNKYFNNASYSGNYFIGARMGFRQSGYDLIMQIPSAKSKVETITFKDFYLNYDNWANTHVNAVDVNGKKTGSIDTGLISDLTKLWGFWVTGIYDKTTKTTSYLAADDDYNNCYEYNGKGKTIMYGSSGKDSYLVKLSNKSNLYINDLGGTNKLYIQNNLKSLRFFFNVGIKDNGLGYVDVDSNDSISDNLLIFDSKKSMTAKNLKNILNEKDGNGVLSIDRYFDVIEEYDAWNFGSGSAGVYASKNIMKDCLNDAEYKDSWDKYNTFDTIKQQVASWLSNHTQYADSFDVIRNGNSQDVTSLLKIYTSNVPTVDMGH